MESQRRNAEFRINPKDIQTCICDHAWAQAILIMFKHAYGISKG